jgi:hypothetical protein
MAQAVAADAGPDTAIYDLRIARNSDGNAQVESFTRVQGPSPTGADTSNAETVIELDWADATGLVLSSFSTKDIASLVVPYLTEAVPSAGIDYPLAQGPIHLIGHSRGGSLVSSLADQLGSDGIWVDQLTTIDPHPVSSANDAPAVVPANVVFSDNYYETTDPTLNLTDGFASAPVSGSHNVDLDAIGVDHTQTHEWYYGTIDASATTDGASSTLFPSYWYAPAGLGPRTNVGYAYSRIDAGVRPADGLWASFGGTGSRVPVSDPSGTAWPNIGDLVITSSGTSVVSGQAITTNFDFESDTTNPTVTLYLDSNQNPYDSNAYKLGSGLQYNAGTSVYHPSSDVSVSTTGIPAGTYYLMAEISDGTHTRFTYDKSEVTVTPAPVLYEPDLTGSIYYAPSSVVPGNKGNPLGITFADQGNVPIKGSYYIAIYASLDDVFDSSDILIGTIKQRLNLRAGASSVALLKFASPSNVPDGTYHLIAYLDSSGYLSESNTANNAVVSSSTTTITAPFVDIAATFSSVPVAILREKKATATVRLTNNGNVSASGSAYEQLFSSEASDGTGAAQVGSLFKNVKLKPGQSVLIKVNFYYIDSLTSIYLSGLVTYTGIPADRSTTNNYFISTIPIPVL